MLISTHSDEMMNRPIPREIFTDLEDNLGSNAEIKLLLDFYVSVSNLNRIVSIFHIIHQSVSNLNSDME